MTTAEHGAHESKTSCGCTSHERLSKVSPGGTVGRRSPTESVARIYRAFLRQRTWSQAELAREIEIGIPALRKRLDELTALGMPLDRDDRDPPQIYWSVPASWFPDSVAFDKGEVGDLLHVL